MMSELEKLAFLLIINDTFMNLSYMSYVSP